MSTYTIRTAGSHQGRALDATYETQEDAAEALRVAMGWSEIHLSGSYAAGDGHDSAVSAYETEEACERDQDGAHAPRITAAQS
jgi:hypothetical protein